jgi:hypothetical protein
MTSARPRQAAKCTKRKFLLPRRESWQFTLKNQRIFNLVGRGFFQFSSPAPTNLCRLPARIKTLESVER